MVETQKAREELLKKLGTFLIEEMSSITSEYTQEGYIKALKLFLDATEEER